MGVGVCLDLLQRISQPLLCCMILYICTLGLALYTVHMYEGKVCQLFTGFVIFADIVICWIKCGLKNKRSAPCPSWWSLWTSLFTKNNIVLQHWQLPRNNFKHTFYQIVFIHEKIFSTKMGQNLRGNLHCFWLMPFYT